MVQLKKCNFLAYNEIPCADLTKLDLPERNIKKKYMNK